MKTEDIRARLLQDFSGKKIEAYDMSDLWFNSIKPYFEECGIKTSDMCYTTDRFNLSIFYLTPDNTNSYIKSFILDVSVRRSKGKSHYNFFGSYTDYAFKDAWVNCFREDGDVSKAIESARADARAKQSSADEDKHKAYNIFKDLFIKGNYTDPYKLREDLQIIEKNFYAFKELLKDDDLIKED
jgi:hypothetical protein